MLFSLAGELHLLARSRDKVAGMVVAPLFYYALWAFSVILQVSIAFAMVRRKLRTEFPFFFYYTFFQVLSNSGLFFVFRFSNRAFYFYAYCLCVAISAFLSFFFIREVFDNAFR